MPQFQQTTIDIPSKGESAIAGDYILRGTIGRAAKLNVKGNVKLGHFSEVGESVTITADSIMLSDQFAVPYGLRLNANEVTIDHATPPKERIFSGELHVTAPVVNAMPFLLTLGDQGAHFIAPEEAEDTRLSIGMADGHKTTIVGYDHVQAGSLCAFALSPNKRCGINCVDFEAKQVSDSMIRAETTTIETATGKLMFMPHNGAYDYGAKHPGSLPPDEMQYLKAGALDLLSYRPNELPEELQSMLEALSYELSLRQNHPRDFARDHDTTAAMRKAIETIEAIDPGQITQPVLDEVMKTVSAIPHFNLVQMLYRHADEEESISRPVRTTVLIDHFGTDSGPTAAKVYYGNINVRARIADHSKIEVESGKITLGSEDTPAEMGRHVILRANEIHLHMKEMPEPEVLKTWKLEGQIYINGQRREDLDQLRSPTLRTF